MFSVLLFLLQSAPDYLLSAAQTHSGGMCLHSSGLQVVQLGDSGLFRWEALVGICRPGCDSAAA